MPTNFLEDVFANDPADSDEITFAFEARFEAAGFAALTGDTFSLARVAMTSRCTVTIIVPVKAMSNPSQAIAGRVSFRKNLAPNAVHIGTVAIIKATFADVVRDTAIKNRNW